MNLSDLEMIGEEWIKGGYFIGSNRKLTSRNLYVIKNEWMK